MFVSTPYINTVCILWTNVQSKCDGPENGIAHFFKARTRNPRGETNYTLATAANLRVIIRKIRGDMKLILIKTEIIMILTIY